ncbi:radical SAM protein [Kordia zhangzhouensis]|uniref:radical SAM protein n=1 Tax=Kordia zhangzhouensis TaxID=1620405 RepID=UPI0006293D17|nr:radical SAM protein [Kordia zhangzhouensis]
MAVKDIVSKYFNKHLFVFLPNLCNSGCEFCYVEPLNGKSAKLSRKLLSNFEVLITQAKEIGFETIRITGGEPLIFSNFLEIIKILKKNQLNYTLMTNGQNIHNYLTDFEEYLPAKVTVSFHSLKRYFEIFKNDIDLKKFFSTIKSLREKKVEIATTTLYLEENHKELPNLIKFFEKKEIDSLKIIYPNNNKQNSELIKRFVNSNFKSSTELRITDFNQSNCLLKTRGFLSVILGDLSIYNCCTTVGKSENKTEIDNGFDLGKLTIKQYENNLKISQFPCKTNLNTCPIALKKITKGNNA